VVAGLGGVGNYSADLDNPLLPSNFLSVSSTASASSPQNSVVSDLANTEEFAGANISLQTAARYTGSGGTTAMSGLTGLLSEAYILGSGAIASAVGLWAQVIRDPASTADIDQAIDLVLGGGDSACRRKYGLYIVRPTGGTEANWAIYAEGGETYFPGRMILGGAADNGQDTLQVLGRALFHSGINLQGSTLQAGAGSPEGILIAPPGSLYLDVSGGSARVMWVKASGYGNTGWKPLVVVPADTPANGQFLRWNAASGQWEAANDRIILGSQTDYGAQYALQVTGASLFNTGVNVQGCWVYAGAGSPEGTLTAPPGSLYFNASGGAGTSVYIKESGYGNTGWVALLTSLTGADASKLRGRTISTAVPAAYQFLRWNATSSQWEPANDRILLGSATDYGAQYALQVTGGALFNSGINVQGCWVYTGSASPEGVLTAPPGSLCFNASGGAGTSAYIKESGYGNTGWKSLVTSLVGADAAKLQGRTLVNTAPAAYQFLRWNASASRWEPANDRLLLGSATDYGAQYALQVTGATLFNSGVNLQGCWLYSGSGSPENVITAPPGSLYFNASGGAGTSVYVKESGYGSTGWKALLTSVPA
jgi:hypothetical protein